MSICNPSKVCESYFTTHIEYFTHIAAIPGIKSACVREKCSEREREREEREREDRGDMQLVGLKYDWV